MLQPSYPPTAPPTGPPSTVRSRPSIATTVPPSQTDGHASPWSNPSRRSALSASFGEPFAGYHQYHATQAPGTRSRLEGWVYAVVDMHVFVRLVSLSSRQPPAWRACS
ncbi:hypothetical protein I350_04465 [Cryptococcus amylolentus CBS 6273]|uniref:Uncharacterized protein n=1 Tax=Cryptococcus amylolentus CBS 6273 TaxID=1296118 RepID=A0A1E3K223_9TREE|nr:hypothetical protein I350_04465 [Cryptococcus amylolentus CBS 6273]